MIAQKLGEVKVGRAPLTDELAIGNGVTAGRLTDHHPMVHPGSVDQIEIDLVRDEGFSNVGRETIGTELQCNVAGCRLKGT